eukprot:SAG11_NODE_7741_length_1102_cov_1.451645_1_plen_98_part_01
MIRLPECIQGSGQPVWWYPFSVIAEVLDPTEGTWLSAQEAEVLYCKDEAALAPPGEGEIRTTNGFHGNDENNDHMFYTNSNPGFWNTRLSPHQYCTNH